MEKLLYVLLISITIAEVIGQPYNAKNKETEGSCIPFSSNPGGVSDCIDLQISFGEKNYDHCCYMRYQHEGIMDATCIPLKEENYLDIVDYKRRFQKGDETLEYSIKNSKIYDIDCFSSYLKVFGIYLLLALLF